MGAPPCDEFNTLASILGNGIFADTVMALSELEKERVKSLEKRLFWKNILHNAGK